MTRANTDNSYPRTSGKLLVALLMTSFTIATLASEAVAFPVSPSTLTYTASIQNPTPESQTITFRKKSMVARPWRASDDAAWMTISPSSGTIAREQDQVTVQVSAVGLAEGTYNGTVSIAIEDKRGRTQVMLVPVTFVVTGGTTTPVPSILLNPTSLTFSGTAGGTAPPSKLFSLTNPTGGTLNWSLSESEAWLGLNVTSGTTTTEIDSISANISTAGLAAGTYTTAITVTASGASNSPQTLPVTLTLNPPTPTTNGSATLTWSANMEEDLAGYNVYVGTQPGVYGPPIPTGLNTTYTVGNLTGGKTYYFSVTAFDNAGNESQHSIEVSKPIL